MTSAAFVCIAASLPAQAAAPENEALAMAAERAAIEAERAAAAAREAVIAAENAAKAARSAANAARIAAGLAPSPADKPKRDLADTIPAEKLRLSSPQDSSSLASQSIDVKRGVASALSSSIANGSNDGFLKSSRAPDLQVIASDKDKVASLAWSVDISRPNRNGKLSAEQLTLTASGRFDGENDTSLLGLKGFSNGTEVKLKYIRYLSSMNLQGRELAPVDAARNNCLSAGNAADQCNPYVGDGVGPFLIKWNPGDQRELLDIVLPGSVFFYGGELGGNQATYKYLDRTAFKLDKTNRYGWSGSIFGGSLFNAGLTSVTAGYTYQRTYKEADPVTLCQPVPATIQTQCITAADGRPTKNSDSILSLELRHAFGFEPGKFATLAIAPQFNYALDEAAWSINLPLYFADDGEGKLRGGIRGGYLNERDKVGGRKGSFQLGIFVGVPFSLLGN